MFAVPQTLLAACWVPTVSHAPPPPSEAANEPKLGVALGSARRGRDPELGLRRRGPGTAPPGHTVTLQQPQQPAQPLPPNWETSRSGSGAATCFQAKSSLPFVLLPAMFSVISQEGCPAGARGQEVLEKTQPSFSTPSFSLLPPTLALRKTQLDRWIQDRPVVPTLPPGTKVQPPSAVPWPGHQMGFSRLAKRLTIEAFSMITFKLHVSSWTPQLY